MSDRRVDPDSIGPQLDLADVALPPSVGTRLATLHGRADPPATVAEWVALVGETLVENRGTPPTVEDLCTSADGRHTFESDSESQSYVCVLDPLAYPFLTDTPGTVRSETPLCGETVEIGLTRDGVALSHDDAVVSLGVAADVDGTEEVTPKVVYRQVCGYIHAFADVTEYEQWARETDGKTTAVPAREGVAVARELATELIDDSAG